jgi:hypothetical protein
MKCTVRDVIEAHATLAHHGGLSLPPSQSMRFARLTRALRQESETAGEAREAIVAKHLKMVDGAPVEVTLPDGRKDREVTDPKAFQADLKAFLDAPAEIPGEPFKLAELGTGPIHSDILAALHFAVTEA